MDSAATHTQTETTHTQTETTHTQAVATEPQAIAEPEKKAEANNQNEKAAEVEHVNELDKQEKLEKLEQPDISEESSNASQANPPTPSIHTSVPSPNPSHPSINTSSFPFHYHSSPSVSSTSSQHVDNQTVDNIDHHEELAILVPEHKSVEKLEQVKGEEKRQGQAEKEHEELVSQHSFKQRQDTGLLLCFCACLSCVVSACIWLSGWIVLVNGESETVLLASNEIVFGVLEIVSGVLVIVSGQLEVARLFMYCTF